MSYVEIIIADSVARPRRRISKCVPRHIFKLPVADTVTIDLNGVLPPESIFSVYFDSGANRDSCGNCQLRDNLSAELLFAMRAVAISLNDVFMKQPLGIF